MKLLFLTNNLAVTLPLLNWLKKIEGVDDVTLYTERIMASQFDTGELFNSIEFIISYNYSHIIKQDVICLFPHKIINLHTSMLPWNRGANPNIWSFIEGTPTGVTIHEIDTTIDTGDILLQREIVFDFKSETLKSAYDKSHIAMRKLFCDNWGKLKDGLIKPKPQSGTRHLKKDSQMFDHIIDNDDTIAEFILKYNDLTLDKSRPQSSPKIAVKDLCVAFDFDGVIVNTVGLLYDTYLRILDNYNITGDADEFESLNGASIKEIVDHILVTHKIDATSNQLMDRYVSELNKIYENATLNHGIVELLCYLNNQQIKIALVSGGSFINIDKTVEQLGIKKYFHTIVSGDDVKRAKPSSEIYEKLKSKMPNHTILAVEDSYNGIVSAKTAGVSTVYYDQHGKGDIQSVSNANYTIHNFEEVKTIIYATERQTFSVQK